MGEAEGTTKKGKAMNEKTGRCGCGGGRVVVRRQPPWTGGQGFYGLGIAARLRVHTGDCPLPDEVLASWTVRTHSRRAFPAKHYMMADLIRKVS